MNLLKLLLNGLILLAIIIITYLYTTPTIHVDLFAKGKLFFNTCLVLISFILLRFSLQRNKTINSINLVISLLIVLLCIPFTQNIHFLFKTWNYILLLLLTQGTLALWTILNIKTFSTIQQFVFLTGPFLVGTHLITGWSSYCLKSIITISLAVTTIISFVSLFHPRD